MQFTLFSVVKLILTTGPVFVKLHSSISNMNCSTFLSQHETLLWHHLVTYGVVKEHLHYSDITNLTNVSTDCVFGALNLKTFFSETGL